jgi:nitrite reductase/ring-hydroxylating ferredoxin subunit
VSDWRALRFAPAPGTRLCAVDDIPPTGLDVVLGEGKDAFRIAVFRTPDGLRAYLNRCPHFGIPLNVRPTFTLHHDAVLCVSHFALFRLSDGYCVEGPCEGGSLDEIPVAVTEDELVCVG